METHGYGVGQQLGHANVSLTIFDIYLDEVKVLVYRYSSRTP